MRNPWAQTGNYRTSYEQDTTIFATYREIVSVGVLLVALVLLPQFLERSQVLTLNFILIYAIAVLGLNITTGYAGLISVGQAAFMGVGAYTVALAAPYLPFYLTIPLGAAVAAVFGAIVGIPSLRVKHLYLALATLAFQEIFVWSVGRMPALAQGASIPVEMRNFLGYEIGFRNHNHFWYYVILFTLVLMVIAWRNLLRGKYGRALVAVRDNDRAADAMGMDPGRTKLMAFALGALYAGVAGGLLAYFQRSVVIEEFTLAKSVGFLAMAIVGGLGTVVGSLLGPAFIEYLRLLMERFSEWIKGNQVIQQVIPPGVDVASALLPLSFGLVIVLFLMFEPRGLYNWWRLVRSYFRTWPFKY
ncbi:branched-chain amino acid ABC transporter permease [Calidithermus timidus]|jgi:branched-chain amino acid transport system permease protein|uniref:branched-chain amino acid ABC transporter permease n=1 Tax=Calidithermus timidus TaxID=307124 RepID=UPI000361733D|nr:branched-chain amino acid ABC transporter permease [Calidithermus timidus]